MRSMRVLPANMAIHINGSRISGAVDKSRLGR
jgi:hypothetical protein